MNVGDQVLVNSPCFDLTNVKGIIVRRSRYQTEPRTLIFFVKIDHTTYTLTEDELGGVIND